MARVHPSSIVESGAELAHDVTIGPFCHVRAGARIGPRTQLLSHVVIAGTTTLGAANVVHPFAVGWQPIAKHWAGSWACSQLVSHQSMHTAPVQATTQLSSPLHILEIAQQGIPSTES